MSQTTLSPNMSLPVPIVGSEPGPDYAQDINVSLGIIDQHTHLPGSGVLITPDAIDINAALTFSNQFAINLAGLTLTAQSSTPAINTIYESGNDLYFVDGVGNNVRITQSGAVAGTPGSIANLVPPASATYSAGSSTFVWQSNTSIAANMDFGAAIMRNISPNSTYAVTLRPQPALGSNYTLTLPAIPVANSFMTLDTSGNMAGSIAISGGLTDSNVAANAFTQAAIDTDFRQMRKEIFTSSGTFTAPANTSADTIFKVTVIGGGGSGGTGGAGSTGGGGGGGGGTAIAWIDGASIPPSSTHTVTVGTGGAGVSGGSSNVGNTGVTSSFGSLAVATGGVGGRNTTAPAVRGGVGGVGTTGNMLISGQAGGGGYNVSALANVGGQGGGTTMGGGGFAGTQAVAGGAGGNYGGGGGGAASGTSGAGASGIVIVEWLQ